MGRLCRWRSRDHLWMRWLFNLDGRAGAAYHLLKTFENFFAIKDNKIQPTDEPHGYKSLNYDRPALQAAMRNAYYSLINIVTTDAFRTLMEDLGALHPIHQPKFVFDVLLSDEALAARGIKRPENILIERSAFGDPRPKIFVVKCFLPKEFSNVWQNVNITFDNQFIYSKVKRDPDISRRKPLPVTDQAAAMARGDALEQLA